MSSAAADLATRQRRSGLLLALLAFAQLIVSIDYNIVYVALPEIGSGLGFSSQTLQWVVSAYAVAFGGFLLFGGRASDLFGRRRMFVLGLSLYAVSSLVGGLAGSPALLVGARAVQGLGGAFLFPATLALVVTSFTEGKERNRALSVWAAAGASGMVIGSLLGGVLTQAFGWQAVFYVNVPLAGGAALLALSLITPDGAREKGRRFDLPGALTATVGATLVVFTLVQAPTSGWTSPLILTSALVGLALVAAFIAIEARSADPLMPLRLFRNPNLSTGVATTFLFMATFGTLLYFLTVYFQTVHGYTALETGNAFLIPMVAGFLGSMLGGKLATRFGIRPTLISSFVIGGAGTAAMGLTMSTDGSYLALLPGLVVLSVCQGVIFTTMFAASSTGVHPYEQGIASGIVSTGQQVGSAVGLAVLVAIANSGTEGLSGEALRTATNDGLRTAVFVATAGIALLVLVALNFKKAPQGGSEAQAAPAEAAPVAEPVAS
ncbi:MFS transporter [Kitasatospora sp. NPDC049258]|uniref:MFS transporter n=1 Tax=Kitasatospora sp. NPDC049258 TaxID=3155394 RepID=UPI00341C2DA0